MTLDNLNSKGGLRARFKSALASRPATASEIAELFELIKTVLPVEGFIGAFRAKDHEIDLSPILTAGRFAFPIIKNSAMEFLAPESMSAFNVGEFGILEPDSSRSKVVGAGELKALLIPGLAFDRKGHRLGRGGGFYDRYLQNFSGLKIGVAMSAQITEWELPIEAHDVAMDIVVTEKFMIRQFQS